jgi:hypothetical protein
VDASNKQVSLSSIPISASGGVTARKIYRTKAGQSVYWLLSTISDNSTTTYTDNIADADLVLAGDFFNPKENNSFGKITVDSVVALSLGSSNTFIGQNVATSNIYATWNTAVGVNSLNAITTGSHNSALGAYSLYSNTQGVQNVAYGSHSLRLNTTGAYNTAIGISTLGDNLSSNNNTALGYWSGRYSTGAGNVFVGYFAGAYETGNDSFYVNDRDRSNTANDKSLSLLYGIFNDQAAAQKLTINATVRIGGTAQRATSVGSNVLNIFNGNAPAGTLTNGCSFYSTSGEMRVMDAAGNATLLSPHDKTTNEWIFDSVDTITGKRVLIDMEKMMRKLNEMFGLDFVHDLLS